MYRVIVINNGEEEIIHEPTANEEAPHIKTSSFKEILSQAEQFTFNIPYANQCYNLVKGLNTKVKIIDTRDNSVKFTGRVLNVKDGMPADGKFSKDVTCEGALNYLNDSQTDTWHFGDQTPEQILQFLLDKHNEKMEDDTSRKIYLGTIEVTQHITVDTNGETILNAIITKLHNILGGDFRIRETNNILYLDYLLAQGENNEVTIQIGINAKQLIREYDPTDVITRGIVKGYGEGINQLTIESVNYGLKYLEDSEAKAKYGVIEGLITNKDIQNANTLKIYGQTVLDEKKQPKLILDTAMMDRSVYAEYSMEKYDLGDTLHILSNIMDIDVYARVTERERDILNTPWLPNLTISTRPITLSDQIIDLKQRNMNLENCPQGSTYIDTFGYAENIDASHSFQLPIWLSPDILYVNRVRLHVDSQKFRAYEKGMAGGGGTTTTTSSGGGSTQTSSSGGGSTQTSSSAGQSSQTSSSGGGGVQTSNLSVGLSNAFVSAWKDAVGTRSAPDAMGQQYVPTTDNAGTQSVDLWWLSHTHNIDHNHAVNIPSHTHTVQTPAHTHNVDIPSHTHTVNIPDHTHSITIPDHTHAIEYGIFEDTYPEDVQIKINGTVIPGITLSDGSSIDVEISQYVGTPGETYNLEITSSRNGRVNVWVSIQAFIQIK